MEKSREADEYLKVMRSTSLQSKGGGNEAMMAFAHVTCGFSWLGSSSTVQVSCTLRSNAAAAAYMCS